MTTKKEKIMRRLCYKAASVKTCPFCARIPSFEFRIDESRGGSIGHYAIRRGCCQATGMGQTELFFHKSESLSTFKGMSDRLISNWNHREGGK